MISFEQSGDYKRTKSFLQSMKERYYLQHLDALGRQGVEALSMSTPTDTGKTAGSWYYQIREVRDGVVIEWLNSNVVDYVNIALILQYGHATRNGGYYSGVDYINPAMRPIFDKIAKDAWEEVRSYNQSVSHKFKVKR